MIHRLITLAKDVIQGKPAHLRSPLWAHARAQHLLKEPNCQYCMGKTHVQVHHIQPFHIRPELELDPGNLITLCETPGKECHLKHGPRGNWKMFEPFIRLMCRDHKRLIRS